MSFNTLLSMRVFCTVAELRSFTAAAGKLNIAHSSVSKHAAMLERRRSTPPPNRPSRDASLAETAEAYPSQARRSPESVDE